MGITPEKSLRFALLHPAKEGARLAGGWLACRANAAEIHQDLRLHTV
jgi:hypothetical protein